MAFRRIAKWGAMSVVGLGGAGGYMYYKRLAENKAITAEAFNELQNPYEMRRAMDALGTKDAPLLRLFRYTTCPFCGKVKAFLDYHGIRHECVEVEPMFKGQLAGQEYKKVPQLQFCTVGKTRASPFMVDSDLIVDALAEKFGQGHQLKDPKVIEWRQWARETLVRCLVVNINTSLTEAWKGYDYIDKFDSIPLPNKLFLKVMGAPIMYLVSEYKTMPALKEKGTIKEGDDVAAVLHTQINSWVDKGIAKGPFHGGKKPDLADLDIYGVLQSVRGHRVYEDLEANTKIKAWLTAMDKACHKTN